MTTACRTPLEFQATSAQGRWYIPVPWDLADNLQEKLSRRGLRSTLCLNPKDRQARLELWPDVSPDEALTALTGTVPIPAL